MQTLLHIVEKAGGFRPSRYLSIENPPFLDLVIEALDESGPLGLPAISLAHYGKQNGDPMRDPEMCFEVVKSHIDGNLSLDPFYWRNDYVAVEQFSRSIVRGHYVALLALHRQHQQFALQWDNYLRLQGFLEAFSDKSIRG
jgi:hypothetical protein